MKRFSRIKETRYIGMSRTQNEEKIRTWESVEEISSWFGNSSVQDTKELQRVIQAVERCTRSALKQWYCFKTDLVSARHLHQEMQDQRNQHHQRLVSPCIRQLELLILGRQYYGPKREDQEEHPSSEQQTLNQDTTPQLLTIHSNWTLYLTVSHHICYRWEFTYTNCTLHYKIYSAHFTLV